MYSSHIGNQAQSSTNTPNVQFGEPMSLLGAACRNMDKGIRSGAEMIQMLPNVLPSMGDSSKS